jgi:hypothetical protein
MDSINHRREIRKNLRLDRTKLKGQLWLVRNDMNLDILMATKYETKDIRCKYNYILSKLYKQKRDIMHQIKVYQQN